MIEDVHAIATEQPSAMTVFDTQNMLYVNDKVMYSEVIAQTDTSRVVLFSFRAGHGLKEHRSDHPIVVQVLQGRITFGIAGRAVILRPGMILTLKANVPHTVLAHADAVMLLTLQ